MSPEARAKRVRVERKAYRAANPPALPVRDAAGLSTKPWGSNGRPPSYEALRHWQRATGQPALPSLTPKRRKRKRFFGLL